MKKVSLQLTIPLDFQHQNYKKIFMNELCHNSNTLSSISVVGHHLGQYAIQCIDMYVSILALRVRLKKCRLLFASHQLVS